MRVTSSTYTNLVLNSSQSEQQQLATLQQQISTGNTVQFASDDPLAYEQASQTQSSLAQLNAYTAAANQATTLTSANNQAMTSLHQLVAQASELATSVTSTMSTSQMQAVGTQITALLSQITSITNQKAPDGTYLFGGTSNQPPINTSTGTYNSAANGQTNTIEVQPGNAVQTGIVAGGSGTPPSDGFLYDSSTGVDVLAAIKQAATDLNAGNATAVQGTDLPALNTALDHLSMYVGSTAASMSAVQTASQTLSQQTTSKTNQLNSLTQTNLPNISLQLQQIQAQYQASLEAGTRIMGLSILNYIGSVPTA
jgi:flagellar hook-associated protein 3 FlgL